MKNPKIINVVQAGATYEIPTYLVTDGEIVDGAAFEIRFCKGSTKDNIVMRQQGVFVESLLKLAQIHLQSVNVGDLATRETSTAIIKIQEAMHWLNERAEDRKLREVQATYEK